MFVLYLYQGMPLEYYQLNINILNVRRMDKRIVGVNAGNVWHALNEVKRISIPELARKLNLSVESTALAVGWLARENKVCIHRVNGLIEVCDENQFGFTFG